MYSCVFFWCEFTDLVAFSALLCDPVTPSHAREDQFRFLSSTLTFRGPATHSKRGSKN